MKPDLDSIAAHWIARRDHGLSADEQHLLSTWLEIPAHAEAFARCEATWAALPKLRRLSPSALDSLYAPKRRLAPILWLTTAAAAAIALAFVNFRQVTLPPGEAIVQSFTAPADAESRVALPDGSIAVLHRGSQIAFGSFDSGRRVRLLSGEAHFTVSKTSPVPFYVHADKLVVRDIGTAFNVRLDSDRVSVLVTQGSVAVLNSAENPAPVAPDPQLTNVNRLTFVNQAPREVVLTVGQQVVVETKNSVLEPRAPAPAEIEQTLAWKSRRISFDRTSLSDAVQELNRYNVRQLRISDPEINSVLLAGGVQSDNLDAFVALLDSGFGVTAELRGNEIVLRKAR
jgi:transmembrane sensor